ncbi:MAG: glutathione S-transferase family protein [Hyphomonadaceae bacterium]
MSLTFRLLSGSPFSWKVWLALEHSGLHYETRWLRVDAGDLQTPEFRALNPKGKLPVLTDGELALSESDAIAEYVAELAEAKGVGLWPRDVRERALARRFACAATAYVYPSVRQIMQQTLFLGEGEPDPTVIAAARAQLAPDLSMLTHWLKGEYAAGQVPTLADYTLYPFVALLKRIDAKREGVCATAAAPDALLDWATRVEALPWFARTVPPHWQEV